MKNRRYALAVILFLFVFSWNTNAQTGFGIKGGANISYLTRGADDNHLNGHLGFMFRHQLNKHFFIQPELLYSKQKYTEREKFWIDSYYGYISIPSWFPKNKSGTLEYIQLPVYGGVRLPWDEIYTFILGLGPYFAYDLEGDIDDIDFGMSFIAGLQIQKLFLSAAYEMDLSQIDYGRNVKISLGVFF